MAKKSKSDETILYVIANEKLGWRKVGIGFGNRLEKWRSDGWVLEQQVLFSTRKDAALAERVVKDILAGLLAMERRGKNRPRIDEGATEAWPFEWGTVDLSLVHDAVNTLNNAAGDATWRVQMAAITDLIGSLTERMDLGDPDAIRLWDQLEPHVLQLQEKLNKEMMRRFVEEESPRFTREQFENAGVDWGQLVRRRQDYWSVRAATASAVTADLTSD